MQHKRQFAIGGVFAAAATAVVGVALAIGGQPVEQPPTRPVGQVEREVSTSTESSATTTSDAPVVPLPQDAPPVADDAPVNEPVAPAEDIPAPGVPYDSDGATVYPNPPNMAPGELAPRPPTQNPPGPPEPPMQEPVVPGDVTEPINS